MTNRLVVLALPLLAGGCALMTKADPVEPRFFSPEPALEAATPAKSAPAGLELRLRRVQAAPHLKEAIVYRDDAFELGFYEDRRWSEEPAEYLRRALARVLFEERGVARATASAAPHLEVELTAFEEIRGEKPEVRVRLVVVLLRDERALLERTVTVRSPLPPGDGEGVPPRAVAKQLGTSLRRAVDQAAGLIIARLSRRAP